MCGSIRIPRILAALAQALDMEHALQAGATRSVTAGWNEQPPIRIAAIRTVVFLQTNGTGLVPMLSLKVHGEDMVG